MFGMIHFWNSQTAFSQSAFPDRTFTTPAVRRYAPILLELRNVLTSQLASVASQYPKGLDIFPFFHTFAFDVITRLTFGSEIRAQTTKQGAEYPKTFERWQLNTNKVSMTTFAFGSRIARFLLRKIIPQWEADGKVMWDLVDANKERIRRGEARASIMDAAYEIVAQEKLPGDMTEAGFRKAMMSVLFAGEPNRGSCVSCVLLTFHPRQATTRPLHPLASSSTNSPNAPISNPPSSMK
jgi:hypothetical protein